MYLPGEDTPRRHDFTANYAKTYDTLLSLFRRSKLARCQNKQKNSTKCSFVYVVKTVMLLFTLFPDGKICELSTFPHPPNYSTHMFPGRKYRRPKQRLRSSGVVKSLPPASSTMIRPEAVSEATAAETASLPRPVRRQS